MRGKKPTLKTQLHPEGMTLAEMKSQDVARRAESADKGISKSATLIKAGDNAPSVAAPKHPTPEQLAKINLLTMTPKTAEELYVIDTLSMNDLPDRDDDFFTTECVQQFASLPQPFSPIGKSYMVDHAYKVENARGRIFDTNVKSVDLEGGGSATFLTNSIYVPNTPQYADFIESVDFGINWAVSVGVTLGKSFCSVCEAPFSSWGYWCSEGHDKGYYYDPNSTEVDSYGWPIPVQSTTAGAVKCLRGFSDPKDFYELSQVFLGAQYFAGTDRAAGIDLASATKTAGFLSVSDAEAEKLPIPHEPQKVRDARKNFTVKSDDEGSLVWTDDAGIGWTFDPLDPEASVLCLGRTEDDAETFDAVSDDDENNEGEVNEDGSTEDSDGFLDPEGDGSDDEGDDPEDAEGVEGEAPLTDEVAEEDAADDPEDDESEGSEEADSEDEGDDEGDEPGEDDPSDQDDSDDDDEDDTEEDKLAQSLVTLMPEFASQKGVLLSKDAGDGVTISKSALEGLVKLAEFGKQASDDLRTDALAWYVRANATPERRGVKTEAFQKMLNRVGDDPELLKEIIAEQKDAAQARFPGVARRSSAAKSDLNEPTGPSEVHDYEDDVFAESDKKVSRLHAR